MLRRARSVARVKGAKLPVWIWSARALAEGTRVKRDEMAARAVKPSQALAPLVLEGDYLRFAKVHAVQWL